MTMAMKIKMVAIVAATKKPTTASLEVLFGAGAATVLRVDA